MDQQLGARAMRGSSNRVIAAANGNQRVLDDLLAEIEPKIVNYCRARIGRSTRGDSSADDVAQEALLGMVRSLHLYRGDDDGLLQYAYAIAKFKIIDFFRDRSKDRSTPVESLPEWADNSDEPTRAAMHSELRTELAELLDTLTFKHRQVLELRMLADMSIQEVAVATGSTPGAVRVQQHRALTNLRRRIGTHADLLVS